MNTSNKKLLFHLKKAAVQAANSYYYSELNPDEANPTFGDEVGEHLKAIYNALCTGWYYDKTYEDEIFK